VRADHKREECEPDTANGSNLEDWLAIGLQPIPRQTALRMAPGPEILERASLKGNQLIREMAGRRWDWRPDVKVIAAGFGPILNIHGGSGSERLDWQERSSISAIMSES